MALDLPKYAEASLVPLSLALSEWNSLTCTDTSLISSSFVQDLLRRKDAEAGHIIQAVGFSSLQKERTLLQGTFQGHRLPYTAVTKKPIQIQKWTWCTLAPHTRSIRRIVGCHRFWARTCFARKRSCIAAAKAKRGFSIEAIWTRFAPLIQMIRKILHEEKVIGDVQRTFCGFGLDLDITSLPSESRYKDPALGAGSLLDIGIYSLTWAWYR